MPVSSVSAILTQTTQLIQKGRLFDAEEVIKRANGTQIKGWFGPDVFVDDGSRFLTAPAQAALATEDDESLLAFLRDAVKAGPAAQAVADQMLPGARLALGILGQVSSAVGKKSPLPAQYGFRIEETPDGVRVEFRPNGKSFHWIAREINAESRRLYGWNTIEEEDFGDQYEQRHPGFGYASDWDKLQTCEQIVVYPLVKGSNNKDGARRDDYLRERGMSFASKSAVACAAGFYRLLHGFKDVDDRDKDTGDLLKGQSTMVDTYDHVYSISGCVTADVWNADKPEPDEWAAGSPASAS